MIKKMFIDRQFRLPRIWSNNELRKISDLFHGDVVNISGWNDQDKEGSCYNEYFLNASTYSITNLGGVRGRSDSNDEIILDLTSELPFGLSRKFDVCYNHTTLEHVYDVVKAFSNICEMSRDIVILVVPFSQEQHETDSFKDFWRFTPSSIRYLFKDNGFEVVYEAESKYSNAGIYLFYVASRRSNYWKSKMPQYTKISFSGKQLSFGLFSSFRRVISYFFKL